jgi:hypothetical protein
MWGALIGAALEIVPGITGKMEADRVARFNSRQSKLETGVAVNADLEESARAIGRAATLAAASGGGLTGSALNVIDDLSRQAMARARAAVFQGISLSDELAAQTISRGQVVASGVRAATPLLTSWAGSGGGGAMSQGAGFGRPSRSGRSSGGGFGGGNVNTGFVSGGAGGNANFGGG